MAQRKREVPLADALKERARVVGVGGPFASIALVVMPMDLAERVFPDGLTGAGVAEAFEAVERDRATLREYAPAVADSALAATATAMALELANPFNSATSKSMCAARLIEAVDKLRELAPPKQEEDEVERARKRRADRLARQSAAGPAPPS